MEALAEEWRDCHFGVYQVSNLGRVRRADTGRLLKPHKGGSRGQYPRVSLWANGEQTCEYVHRLVARAFIGEEQGREVNHKDGDTQNPCVTNLEYVTSAENKRHAKLLRLLPAGEAHVGFKLKEEDVYAIRVLSRAGFSLYYLAGLFECAKTTIAGIVDGTKRKYDKEKVG